MKLTTHQENFILGFFEGKFLPVAEKLIRDGECIIAGDEKLWIGGIGNFIKLESEPRAFGCSRLTFNLNVFMESVVFQEYYKQYMLNLGDELDALNAKYEELSSFA